MPRIHIIAYVIPFVLRYVTCVGERRMGNKKFPTRTKTYHGDVHLREGISNLRTLVDCTAVSIMKHGRCSGTTCVIQITVVVHSIPRSHHDPYRELHRDPSRDLIMILPDLVPNGRHLRVQHTYNSTMISSFLIQQERWRGR